MMALVGASISGMRGRRAAFVANDDDVAGFHAASRMASSA